MDIKAQCTVADTTANVDFFARHIIQLTKPAKFCFAAIAECFAENIILKHACTINILATDFTILLTEFPILEHKSVKTHKLMKCIYIQKNVFTVNIF